MDEIISLNQIDEISLETTEENETPMNINEEVVIFSGGGSIDFEEYPVDSGFLKYNAETGLYSTEEIDLSGKVDKPATNTVQQIVTIKPNGETEGVNLASNSSIATFGSIPRYQNPAYDDANVAPNNMGNLVVADPTKPLHVANKRYVEDNFVSKQTPEFDAGATRGYVYFIDPEHNQTVKKVQIQANADTIPLRNPNGTFYVGTATLPYEAVNKGYVDGLVGDINTALETILGV